MSCAIAQGATNFEALPICEHHQAVFIALVRLDCFFQQVDFVAATLKVHIAALPWHVQP